VLIVVIPGAPGVALLYIEFMARLLQHLEEAAPRRSGNSAAAAPLRVQAVAVSWAGHAGHPAAGLSRALQGNTRWWSSSSSFSYDGGLSLAEHIAHQTMVVKMLVAATAADTVVLAGHSLGAWFALKAARAVGLAPAGDTGGKLEAVAEEEEEEEDSGDWSDDVRGIVRVPAAALATGLQLHLINPFIDQAHGGSTRAVELQPYLAAAVRHRLLAPAAWLGRALPTGGLAKVVMLLQWLRGKEPTFPSLLFGATAGACMHCTMLAAGQLLLPDIPTAIQLFC
jgi:hypothetical protein